MVFELHEHVEEFFRDSVVDPSENSEVLLDPLRVIVSMIVVGDVVLEIEPSKHYLEALSGRVFHFV